MSSAEQPAAHRSFHAKLDTLKQQLIVMSQRAEEVLALSLEAFLERDAGKAEAVLSADDEVDALEVELEALAISLLALQQPMARDLRFIVSALKVVGELERVGDHAVNIAQSALRVVNLHTTTITTPEVADMGGRARIMLRDALDAMMRYDGVLGREVCRRDDEVDALHERMFGVVISSMREDPSAIAMSLELLHVSRNLERVADLATNIAEDAVYLAEGKTIKHHLEDRVTNAPIM